MPVAGPHGAFSQGLLNPGGSAETQVGLPSTTSQVEREVGHFKPARAQAMLSTRSALIHNASPSITTHSEPSRHVVAAQGVVRPDSVPVKQE